MVPRLMYPIFCEVYGAIIVAFYWDNPEISYVITWWMFHQYNWHTKVTCIVAIYSSFIVDNATCACFLLYYELSELPSK